MGAPEIRSKLTFLGERLVSDDVSNGLGLEPTLAYKLGDPILAGQGRRMTGGWILREGPQRSYALDEQVSRLVALKPKTTEIISARTELGLKVRIDCATVRGRRSGNPQRRPPVGFFRT